MAKKAYTTPKQSPESSAHFGSWVTLAWLGPLFRHGYKNILSLEDLFPLAERYHSTALIDRFEAEWSKAQNACLLAQAEAHAGSSDKKHKPMEPSIVRILITMFGRGFFPIGLLKFIADILNSIAPLFLQVIIRYVAESSGSNPPPLYMGLIYAFGLFLINMTASTLIQFFFSRATAYSMSMRATLTGAIYRKSMRLSGASRQQFNPGHITNIISTDLIRTEMFIVLFHLQWTFPIQVAVIIGILIHTIGVAALAGLALLVAMVPLQVYVIKTLVSLRKTNAKKTDQRLRLTSETLSSIRVIKFFAWEDSFLERIIHIRMEELKAVVSGNMIRAGITASGFAIPVMAGVVTFIVYSVTSPVFDATVVFTALALFNQLRGPLMWTPQMIGSWADTRVALTRIHALLMSPESTFEPSVDADAEYAVTVTRGDFVWESAQDSGAHNESSGFIIKEGVTVEGATGVEPFDRITLHNIELRVPKGALVAIVGAVGSGKSSLLNATVGQLKPLNSDAKVVFNGSVGYAPQTAWIMNASLRDNILFGLPFDQERYDRAIDVCALRRDLEVLAGGDMAEIGERGINLSGGQKQRVSLARLVYFNSSIVLLDDVLSAVDAHVGKFIFNECICGELKDRTRLLVTHQLHFVPQCDIVVTMKNGRISECGTYAELIASKGEFSALMTSYGGVAEEPDDADEEKHISTEEKNGEIDLAKKPNAPKELMTVEDRETGAVKSSVFITFAVAMGGWGVVFSILLLLVLAQLCRIATDLWLVYWCNRSIPDFSNAAYMWTYFGLGLSQSVLIIVFSLMVAIGGTVAAKTLHQDALKRVIHTPTSFFDTNPLGRVLNRFSRDQDVIDNTLPDAVRMFFISFGMAFSTFCLVSYSTSGWFLVALVPLMAAYYFLQDMYRRTARELKRLDALTRSPLYSHITESMTGVNTIRAYREQARFIAKTDMLIDQNNKPYYLQQIGARWLGMRLEYIGNSLVLTTSLFAVISRSSISPALMGLALSYVLQTTQLLQMCIRQYTEAEVQLVSIERMHYYATRLETEAPGVIQDSRPPSVWPSDGVLEFRNVSMRYQAGLPLVLNKISLKTMRHEKIGVVGRTGSGKSSLMLSIFRMIDFEEGDVVIDGISTKSLGLKDLRSRLSIIPQDPILFSGTVRTNMDPFNEHDDITIWSALEASGLKGAVAEMDGQLDGAVAAGGDNMSVGQRQLLCLARAILRKSSLVVLDECTANVDLETDHQIQNTLRTTMRDATIFTIAHRLNTVIDSDRILVLDGGNIAEFDSPAALLAQDGLDGRPLSVFAGMVQETGQQNATALRALASESQREKQEHLTMTRPHRELQ
ncbi:P-loop containing nucleoside triphosphate hydrolase protein [Chytriomyces cf. hyalinus JEL632]|nr:P-loop containing nucleoside triphosphate hydrolase protein [Chytriomyces cf. hyalinus JEL632]